MNLGFWILDIGFSLAQVATPMPSLPYDIAPPLDVFPYPLWMVATAGGLALLLVLLAIWLIWRWLKNRPAPAPLTPQQQALAELQQARARVAEMAPYEFSILVSDILRRFVTARFGLRATQQTSPEFLASLGRTSHFTVAEKELLAAFLEKCDLIKFAHIDAARADSEALLEQAIRFVEGSTRPDVTPALAGGAS